MDSQNFSNEKLDKTAGQSDIERAAIAIIKTEKTDWETGTAFVTEKVAFNMRNLIRQLKKNYWGVFDEPTDPITGRKKIWIPLTESLVEAAVKNIDLDTKDINFRSKNADSQPLTMLVRHKVREILKEKNFGETLDELERQIAINGTAVWKTLDDHTEDGKKTFKLKQVDLLNFYIDPTAHSIQEAPAVIERAVMTIPEIEQMDGWINTQNLQGSKNVDRNDGEFNSYSASNNRNDTRLVEVFERWGLMPKYLLTGNQQDKKTLVEGHIVVSDLVGSPRVHLIEENLKKVKPYEECWYTRVTGRWYGKGIAEKVMMLQLWMNTIVNIRITRSYVSQLGLFKIRKGKGITPQMLSRLSANGAIEVSDMDDIEQMVVQEASQASYNDEQSIQTWAERVTAAFEAATGEPMPASTSATAQAIQSEQAKSQFAMVKEGIGMFLERWINNHLLKIVKINKGDIIKIVGADPEELRQLDEKIAEHVLGEQYKQAKATGQTQTFLANYDMAKESLMSEMRTKGDMRFMEASKAIPLADFNPEVYITNEDINKSVISQNLLSALQLAPEYREQIVQQLFDIMGLDLKPLHKTETMQQPMQPGMNQGMPQTPSQNPMNALQQANTLK